MCIYIYIYIYRCISLTAKRHLVWSLGYLPLSRKPCGSIVFISCSPLFAYYYCH